MDIAIILNLILWIPMVLAFSFFCTFFLLAGYKKGFWRSLISFAMTLISAGVSLPLSKLLSKVLAEPVVHRFVERFATDADVPIHLISSILQGIMQAFFAFLFFGIFFVIFMILSKVFSKKIHFERMDNEPKDQKSLRFAGMALRFLDAVVVTLVLLIPLYGPIAMAMPVASGLVAVNPDNSATQAGLVERVNSNPILVVYTSQPTASVVNTLSAVELSGERFDVAECMWAIEGIVNRYNTYLSAEEEAKNAALSDLVGFLQENVIEEEWSYHMTQILRNEILSYSGENPYSSLLCELLDMDRETYVSNGVALLEFVEYCLEEDFKDFYASRDYTCLPAEFYERFGALINYSEEAILLKKLIMTDAVSPVFDSPAEAGAFIATHVSDEPLPKELQAQEGKAFLQILMGNTGFELLEALVRHPGISYEELMPRLVIELENTYPQDCYYRYQSFLTDPAFLNALEVQFASYETAPLSKLGLGVYTNSLIGFAANISTNSYPTDFYANDALLEDIIRTVGEDFYQNSPIDSQQIRQLLLQALEEAKEYPGVMGYIDIMGAYSGEQEQVFSPWSVENSYSAVILPGEE